MRTLSALLSILVLAVSPAAAQPDPAPIVATVRATGPTPSDQTPEDDPLEGAVEVTWTTSGTVPSTSYFVVTRDGNEEVFVGASTVRTYTDRAAAAGATHLYCVSVHHADQTREAAVCDEGGRRLAPPTSFEASEGRYETDVRLAWQDWSEIEAGYVLTRDAGHALRLDGVDDYAVLRDPFALSASFTFEFWARRASTSTDDIVVNVEGTANGSRTDADVEIGFAANGRFQVRFGSDVLEATSGADTGWHHWAIVYDAALQRRILYRDGVLDAVDVAPAPSLPAGTVLEIGRATQSVRQSQRGHFHGDLDEVRYWTRARTPAEIRSGRTALLRGTEAGLTGLWSMDATAGTAIVDGRTATAGTLLGGATWTVSGAPARVRQLDADATAALDASAVAGYPGYTYRLAAFEDLDGDGRYTEGADAASVWREAPGWRARLAPPGDVRATDGAYPDRVRVTWTDRSASETGYAVYRDGAALETVTDALVYDDLTATGAHAYCVAAVGGGGESVRVCDDGSADGLAAPTDVSATHGAFDDRVVVAWTYAGDAETGFELYRDGQPLATLGADATEYNDFTARPAVGHRYCVEAVSTADPVTPTLSDRACTDAPGLRAAVLAPTAVAVSGGTDPNATPLREDRIDLSWQNPSTTAMLFKVYRDDVLIEVLDVNVLQTSDSHVESDRDYAYRVSAVTVGEPSGSTATVQAAVAQALEVIRVEDAVAAQAGVETSTVEERVAVAEAAVEAVLGAPVTLAEASAEASALVEASSQIVTGRRSIPPPTSFTATIDEAEDHVQLTWDNASTAGARIGLLRTPEGGTPVPLDVNSSGRTSFKDYTGLAGTRYTYALYAFDDAGESAHVTAEGQRTLAPPTDLVASDGTFEDRVRLDWTDHSEAEDGYVIERQGSPSDPWVEIGRTGPNRTAFVDAALGGQVGQTATYRVFAVDTTASGASLSAPSRAEGRTALQAPISLNASSEYGDRIVVVWEDRSAVETGFVLTRTSRGGEVRSVPVGENVESYVDEGVTRDVRYQYCLAAIVDQGGTDVEAPAAGCVEGIARQIASGGDAPSGTTDWTQWPERYAFIGGDDGRDEYGPKFGLSVAVRPDGGLLAGAPGAFLGGVVQAAPNAPSFALLNELADDGSLGDDLAASGDYFATSDEETNRVVVFKRTPNLLWDLQSRVDATYKRVALQDSFLVLDRPSVGLQVCNVEADVTCLQAVTLTPPDGGVLTWGVDLGRDGDRLALLTGARNASAASTAYLYECDTNTGCDTAAEWGTPTELVSPFASSAGAGPPFGFAVAVHGDLAVVGAPDSRGFGVWERDNGTWEQRAVQYAPERGMTEFGWSVAVRRDPEHGARVLVGAPYEDRDGDYAGAGAVYAYTWADGELTGPVRYDATAGGELTPGARFGNAVAVGPGYYVVGAPFDVTDDEPQGAVYTIPFDHEASSGPVLPSDVDLAEATDLDASDGSSPDRIQVLWTDNSDGEDGYMVYRSADGGVMEQVAQLPENATLYDDYAANAGEAYRYCVAAFGPTSDGRTETTHVCDVGWRPANGTIAGSITSAGGGSVGATQVCLDPSPNRGLLFDGRGGFVEAPIASTAEGFYPIVPVDQVGDSPLTLADDFTVEAWVRHRGSAESQVIVERPKAFSFFIAADETLRLQVYTDDAGETFETFSSDTPIPANTWQHVAFTRGAVDGATSNDVTFFVNGQRVATRTSEVLVPRTLYGVLTLGGRGRVAVDPDGKTFVPRDENGDPIEDDDGNILEVPFPVGSFVGDTYFFHGELDEVRIWERARTAAEIQAAMGAPLAGDEPGLAAYWPLDEGRRRVAPDLAEATSHGLLHGGVYAADAGAPLEVCAATADNGSYRIPHVRYGSTTAFQVRPVHPTRTYSPDYATITLSTDSPVQNQVLFSDVSSYAVAGSARYEQTVGGETLSCPAPGVSIHLAQGDDPATDQNVRGTTGADGAFAFAVDPGHWTVRARALSPTGQGGAYDFPQNSRLAPLDSDVDGIDFVDTRTHTLTGAFGGGDPLTCARNIGTATIRIWTEDGCYDRTVTVDSGVDGGAFALELPPLAYLMEVVSVTGAPAAVADDVTAFFERLGAVEVDLSAGDVERNLTYRAPLKLEIDGLEAPGTCSNQGIRVLASDGTPVRTLPGVPVLGEYEAVPLTVRVVEDYGDGATCAVESGTVAVYDGIADAADEPTVLRIEDFADGAVEYTTVGASPNIFSGARIGGVDRSYQKPLTVFAEVEGRDILREERWAIVEGYRERASTFVSATTDEFPALILHDPPGSNSSAWIEEGATLCHRISNVQLVGGGAGAEADLKFGFKQMVLAALFGSGVGIEGGTGLSLGARVVGGRDDTSLDGENREICVSTTEQLTTSDDPGWVGEDIHVGVALNLVFAIADVLEADAATCNVSLSETLAADLDASDPFETTYAYGAWHIEQTLIPELENLIRLAGGDPSIEGEIDGTTEVIRLKAALANWRRQLRHNADLEAEALRSPIENRSFSGGATYTRAETTETTEVTHSESSRIYVDAEGHVGAVFTALGFDQEVRAVWEVRSEWISEEDSTETTSTTYGYTLKDEDAGDYFSVDVAKDPRYGTFVFGTRSGRSSNTCEAGTQCRDNPILQVNPPAQYNVDPADPARFQLTLTNGSESNERRRYVLQVPQETNAGNLGVHVGGGRLGTSPPYLLDPGTSLTVAMDVTTTGELAHDRVAVVMYPPDEYPIWAGEMRGPFALSDTAFFSVHFDGSGGNLLAAQLTEGWNWLSINREGGDVGTVLGSLDPSHGDLLRTPRGEARFDSTLGWRGDVPRLVPGEGYRLRLQKPGVLRVPGQPVEATEALTLDPGWSWVGYVPARRMSVGEALGSLGDRLRTGDAIVGQRAFAQYVQGHGWIGTLRHLLPGQGYAVSLAQGGDLVYPEEPADAAPSPPEVWETTARGPDWRIAPEAFDASMIAVAAVHLDGRPLPQTTLKVAVLDSDRVVGMGDVRYVEALDQTLVFLRVYGEAEGERDLKVHVYEGESDVLYEDVATLAYAAQTRLGDPSAPVTLELANAGQAPTLSDLPTELVVYPAYPNPTVGPATLQYDLPETADVRIAVYDILGRQVALLADEEQPAGRYRLLFDGRSVAPGTYITRVEIGDAHHVRKMTVVR